MRLAALLAGALLLAGCGGGGGESAPEAASTAAAAPAAAVADLDNILQLRSDFEADAGKTRVVLLFSPT